MLGCKYYLTVRTHTHCFLELIDTCWDVNNTAVTIPIQGITELIDTCWDVNVDKGYTHDKIIGINRYMLGCK